jgi:hypothetical protein
MAAAARIDPFLPRDVQHSLPLALLRAREVVLRVLPDARRASLDEQQWRVLCVPAEAESLDASEDAERASFPAPSLVPMIRSMAERGLLERRPARPRRPAPRDAPAGAAGCGAAGRGGGARPRDP